MKCKLANPSLKIWAKTVQLLSGIGDQEIHFLCTDSSISMTTFDASLSVCATCIFQSSFFLSYEMRKGETLSFKIPAKNILNPFKSARFLSRQCHMCEIQTLDKDNKLSVNFSVKNGVYLNHRVKFAVDTDELQVDCDINSFRNWITAEANVIIGSLANFNYNKGISDLTLKVEGTKLLFKNCMTDMVRREGKVYTELSVNSGNFSEYTITEDSELTFPLKEFKLMAHFADVFKVPLSIHFQSSKDPVMIAVQETNYEVTLTLATKLMPAFGSQASSQSTAQETNTSDAISHLTSENGPKSSKIRKIDNGDKSSTSMQPPHLSQPSHHDNHFLAPRPPPPRKTGMEKNNVLASQQRSIAETTGVEPMDVDPPVNEIVRNDKIHNNRIIHANSHVEEQMDAQSDDQREDSFNHGGIQNSNICEESVVHINTSFQEGGNAEVPESPESASFVVRRSNDILKRIFPYLGTGQRWEDNVEGLDVVLVASSDTEETDDY